MKIEINDDEINVKDIIAKMKTELGKHNIIDDLQNVSFDQVEKINPSSLDIKSLYEKVDIVNKSWHSNPEFTITSHRKFLGPIIVSAKKMIRKITRWYINPYARLQNEFNGNVTRTINEMFTQFKNTSDQLELTNKLLEHTTDQLMKKDEQLKILQNQYNEDTKKYTELETLMKSEKAEINAGIVGLEESIQKLEFNSDIRAELLKCLEDTLTKVKSEVEEIIKSEVEIIKSEVENVKNEVQSIKTGDEINSIKNNTRVAVERLRRIERKLKQLAIQDFNENVYTPSLVDNNTIKENKELDFDYFLFEEYYRGSREEIISRQKQYLPYFSDAEIVLDLGCGRGEFTELMLQENINVVSVDMDDDMVSYCRDRGFNIKKMDLLDYLQTIDDNSVDGIFLGQVIEHMKAEDMISMVKLAYRKLKPNSWLIAETPNPRSLSIFAQSFYLDLTHNKPVHPFTSKFIWETEGFRDVEVQYFSPNNPIVQLPPLEISSMDQDVLNRFNIGLQYWNETIFGDQDYFIAGKK